jgi:hypothetical protein
VSACGSCRPRGVPASRCRTRRRVRPRRCGRLAGAARGRARRPQGATGRPVRGHPHPGRGRRGVGQQPAPAGRESLACGRGAFERRAQILSQQPAASRVLAAAIKARWVRASPPAAQRRAGARPFRGPLLDGSAPARADDGHRVRLPAVLAPRRASPDGAGKKPGPARRGRPRSPACPPYAAPSSAGCSHTSSRLSAARIANGSSSHRLTSNCPGSTRAGRSDGMGHCH